jgi:hypothetical protein
MCEDMHAALLEIALYAPDFHFERPDPIVSWHSLDRPREGTKRQGVGEADSLSFLGVVRHKTTHEMHGYRVSSKLDKVMLYPLEELWIHPLA